MKFTFICFTFVDVVGDIGYFAWLVYGFTRFVAWVNLTVIGLLFICYLE